MRHVNIRNEERVMERQSKRNFQSWFFFLLTPVFCVLLAIAVLVLAACYGDNNFNSFEEPVLTLSDGWTLTDGEGVSRTVNLPVTVAFGKNGCYTLSRTLPEMDGELASPALRFYSNYVDFTLSLDGHELYSFPKTTAAFSGATGNTYHFLHMPTGYAGKTVTISLRCQLGETITYLIGPPVLGSKATMLRQDVLTSLPSLTLAGCICILAIGVCVLYFVFHRRLHLTRGTLNIALFSLLFSIYVYFETRFAQVLVPNGYLVCFATLMLLALVPLPLIGVFLEDVGQRFRPVMHGLMLLCSVNLLAQLILNFAGVMSVRTMLPATHAVILLSILTASLCLFFSDRTEKPNARRSLFSAMPLIAGGVTDIVLLNINRPSLNNCFWFATGVTIFIVIQFCGFVNSYFTLYHASLEAKLFADMAYHDDLSGIGNRNAYERKLQALNAEEPPERLCCVVMDINDLKRINDRLGHQAGDAAISEVGAILSECMPECASCFRTGGDEFVILLEDYDTQRTQALAERLYDVALRRGKHRAIPISLAIGFGQYDKSDGDVVGFIQRVDTLMYERKREQKSEGSSWKW